MAVRPTVSSSTVQNFAIIRCHVRYLPKPFNKCTPLWRAPNSPHENLTMTYCFWYVPEHIPRQILVLRFACSCQLSSLQLGFSYKEMIFSTITMSHLCDTFITLRRACEAKSCVTEGWIDAGGLSLYISTSTVAGMPSGHTVSSFKDFLKIISNAVDMWTAYCN